MSDNEALGSDSSDDDYVPTDGEAVSEEEGSGDEEDTTLLVKDAQDGASGESKGKKKGLTERKRKGGIKLDNDTDDHETTEESKIDFDAETKKAKEVEKEEKEKKKSDDLWASFLSDVGGPAPKPKSSSPGIASLCSVKKPSASPATHTNAAKTKDATSSSKVTITKEYDFAGERVKITKEVDANSSEAKVDEKEKGSENVGATSKQVGVKRAGGLGSIMGKLAKAPKISTLEKSKLDWEHFKQENKISEDLNTHNKGKEGFLERKAFLERTDLRQFEIEKNLRLSNSKR